MKGGRGRRAQGIEQHRHSADVCQRFDAEQSKWRGQYQQQVTLRHWRWTFLAFRFLNVVAETASSIHNIMSGSIQPKQRARCDAGKCTGSDGSSQASLTRRLRPQSEFETDIKKLIAERRCEIA
jgi:hypothetical protein